ncbi:MAG: alpha/beta fold hydrolase [Solirubrobacterales bacterium]
MSAAGLAIEVKGEGAPVLLAHGLTATRRYVVMGSTALQRSGHRVISYDARGHGDSEPAPDPAAYEYSDLAADMLAVLEDTGTDRAVVAGASVGAHTAVRMALDHPERVAGLVLVTPAFDPDAAQDPEALAWWDGLAAGLRTGGVEGFMEAYGQPAVDARWRNAAETVMRQRLAHHEHPEAVADALQVVPRSRPFEALDELARIEVPAVVVADRDEADPGHPLEVGEKWADALRCELVVEPPGESPIAWQGAKLSEVIAGVAAQAGY